MDYNLELMLRFPYIINVNGDFTELVGVLVVNTIHYPIQFSATFCARDRCQFRLKMNAKLLKFHQYILKFSDTREITHPVEYLIKLEDLLSGYVPPAKCRINMGAAFSKIIEDYQELRTFYVSIIDGRLESSMDLISLTICDEKKRKHVVEITVNYAHFYEVGMYKITKYDLPKTVDEIFSKPGLLGKLYERFANSVLGPKMQAFFDLMDEIDANCWILDPETPTRRDDYRRIAVDENVSIYVEFDANNPYEAPTIKFLGPGKAVQIYSDHYMEHILEWDPHTNHCVQAIGQIIGINTFPKKPNFNDSDDGLLLRAGDCSICFVNRCPDDKLPEVICPNSSCELNFHTSCLRKWLKSSKFKKFQFEIIGHCPGCDKTIRCPKAKP